MTESKSGTKPAGFAIEELELIRDGLSLAIEHMEREAKLMEKKGRIKTAEYLRDLKAATGEVLTSIEQRISAETKEAVK